jgi:hypothetical protein
MKDFILPGGKGRKAAIQLVMDTVLKLDATVFWKVEISESKRTRSDAQNAYLWAVANKMISDATGYEPEEVHEYLCGQHFGWKDKRVPKTPRNPDGVESVPRRTTTRNEQGKRDVLKTKEFSDYVDFVQRFAAKKLGLFIPDPDPAAVINREKAA